MKIKQLIFFLISCAILICILPSCSNDNPAINNTNQGNGQNTTPIGTPNGVPVTAAIGPTGGSIISADSSFELIIPAGALSSNTNVTIQPVTNFCFNAFGNAFRLTPGSQLFAQPVTVKIHYTQQVLASTYGILMGVARQDASGHWHYFNNIVNDTVNKIISTTITQFGLPGDNNSGGGDISFFDIAHLEPRRGEVSVNNTLGMTVTYEAVPGSDGELTYLPKPIGSWWVDGNKNGNTTIGTIINRQGQSATYKAPAQVPSPDVVMVGALVNTGFNYRGRVIETYLLQSRVKIKSNIFKFHLKINMLFNWFSFSGYPCFLSDGVDMDITVNNNTSAVTISNVLNRFPNVAPPGGTYPDGSTVTWLAGSPPDAGHINVVGVTGFVFTLNNQQYFTITFNHTGTKNPLFQVVPPSGPGYTLGGEAVPGTPPQLTFMNKDIEQTQSTYGLDIRLTVLP